MNRKIAFGIVLFVGIGLFMFTFANPNDKVDNNNGSTQANNTTNEVQNKETDDVAPVINLADPTNVPVEAPAGDNGNTNAPVVPNNGTANVVDNALVEAKEAAIAELKNYKNDYDYPNKEDYNSIVNKYVDEINKASTIDSINKSLEDGKNAIDTLINEIEAAKKAEELAEYKDAAKEKINEYAKDIDLEKTKKEEIITDASKKIDEATTKEEIDGIVEDTEALLDEAAQAELDEYKKAAKEEINNYAAETELNETKKEEIVTDASKKIDGAKTKEEVDGIVESTEALLDEASLNEYKEAAKEELKAYKNDEKYTEENQTVVDGIKETGITDITNAETKDDVDNILATAKEDIDDVPVLTFTVTFKDFYGTETIVEVTHDTLVEAPEYKNVVDHNATYNFVGFDKDLTKVVTGDMVVTAQYEITKIMASVFLLNDGVAIPANGGFTGSNDDYKFKAKVELDLTKENVKKTLLDAFSKNRNKVITTDEAEIKNMVAGSLPDINNAEYVYTYYTLKYENSNGIHIDYARFVNDAPVITLTGDEVITVYEQRGHYDFTKGFSVSDDHTTLTKDDVQIKIIKNNIAQVQKINYEKVGTYVIYYTVTDTEGNTTTVTRTVKVLPNTLKSIELANNNDVYEYGAELNLTVKGTYANGTVKEVAYTIEGFNSNVVGKASATVKVEGINTTLTYNYEVLNKLVGITLSSNNDTYEYGAELNLSVNANYIDGTVVENVQYAINEFANESVGSHTATVSYEGIEETYSYTISNKLLSIALSSNEDTYVYGDSLNLKVNGKYADGTVKEVAYEITNFDTSFIGSSVAYVTVEGFETIEYIYMVDDKIVDLVLSSNNDAYEYGANLNLSATAVYISGAEISNVKYDVANFNNTVVGNGTATISYEGLTKEYKYTIINTLRDVQLSTNNDVYYKGNTMKTIYVIGYYADGTTANLEYRISSRTPFDSSSVGNKSMTIYAEDRTLTYNYEVKYSANQLANLFGGTTASVAWWGNDSELEFYNLPAGATVVSVRRSDKDENIKLRSTNRNNLFLISWGDYDTLRHNWGHTIYVTYSINNQPYTRGYGESFGDID